MKTILNVSTFLFLTTSFMSAQTLNGEFRLRGIPETASAFRFTPDGKFDFFFIYGAVDRTATGTYTMHDDTVKLKSEKEPGMDFPIKEQSRKGKNYTIKVSDPNKYLLSNIICLYYIGQTENVAYTNSEGLIEIEAPVIDRIFLFHELFPDIASLIKDENNSNNHFEVGLSPSLGQVSFKGIDFTLTGDTLTCLPNYVIPFENINYVKE